MRRTLQLVQEKRGIGASMASVDNEARTMDLVDFVRTYTGARTDFQDLIGMGPGTQRLFDSIGNEGLTRALLATNFWRSWMASDAAAPTVSDLGAQPGSIGRSRTIIVSVDGSRRFDLLVLDPTLPKDFPPKSVGIGQDRVGGSLMTGAINAFREGPLSYIGAAAPELAAEVGRREFSILLAREPEFERLTAPLSPLTIDNLSGASQAISTAGVVVEDLTQPGRFGVTAALHGIDPATNVSVDGQTGIVVRTDPVTDSAFVEHALAPSVSKRHINGVMSKIAPRGQQRAEFVGVTSQKRQTVIVGWDSQVPNPSSRRQACVYTGRDAQPGDSGSALITDDDWVVGFAFERTKPGESPAQCSWVWADSVLNRLNVKLA